MLRKFDPELSLSAKEIIQEQDKEEEKIDEFTFKKAPGNWINFLSE